MNRSIHLSGRSGRIIEGFTKEYFYLVKSGDVVLFYPSRESPEEYLEGLVTFVEMSERDIPGRLEKYQTFKINFLKFGGEPGYIDGPPEAVAYVKRES